jgi:hypothetical protein
MPAAGIRDTGLTVCDMYTGRVVLGGWLARWGKEKDES